MTFIEFILQPQLTVLAVALIAIGVNGLIKF